MSLDQVIAMLALVAAVGGVVSAIVAGAARAHTRTTEDRTIRIEEKLDTVRDKMLPREEYERRQREMAQRIDHAHRRIDDIFADRTDPGLGGKR